MSSSRKNRHRAGQGPGPPPGRWADRQTLAGPETSLTSRESPDMTSAQSCFLRKAFSSRWASPRLVTCTKGGGTQITVLPKADALTCLVYESVRSRSRSYLHVKLCKRQLFPVSPTALGTNASLFNRLFLGFWHLTAGTHSVKAVKVPQLQQDKVSRRSWLVQKQ